jgi:FixJ family two-component response regulator
MKTAASNSGVAVLCTTPVVFVVDDDVSVRESLERLTGWAGWRPVTCGSALEFLAQPRVKVPNCLVLDVSLPDINGLDLQRLVVDRVEMPIIFITGFGDVSLSVKAMKGGAVEFLTKPLSDDVLLHSIRTALDHSEAVLRREVPAQLIRQRYASLTRREQEVMGLIVAGLVNWRIGAELGIRECTVKAHRTEIMRKMNARSLAHLIHMSAHISATPVSKEVAENS